MPQVISLEGLPDTVADAIAETVRNLRDGYLKDSHSSSEQDRIKSIGVADRALDELLDTLPTMPSLPDEAVGREGIYAMDGDRG